MSKLFIVSGHSGAGKDFLMRQIKNLHEIVSVTTRPMREGEVDGKNYFFIDSAEFDEFLAKGEFAEHIQYGTGDKYGVWKDEINRKLELGDSYIIAEYNGMKQLKSLYPDAVTIFIYTDLETSMLNMAERGDSMKSIMKRASMYDTALSTKGDYDYVIKNVYGDQGKHNALIMISAILRNEQSRSKRDETRSRIFAELYKQATSNAVDEVAVAVTDEEVDIHDEFDPNSLKQGSFYLVRYTKVDVAQTSSDYVEAYRKLEGQTFTALFNGSEFIPYNDNHDRLKRSLGDGSPFMPVFLESEVEVLKKV